MLMELTMNFPAQELVYILRAVASFLYGTHYDRTCVQVFICLCVWKKWKGVGEPLKLILTVTPELERREVVWYLED